MRLMSSRATAGFSLLLALSASGWTQTADGKPPSHDTAERSAAPAGNLDPRPQGGWKQSPLDDGPYVPLTFKEKAYLFGWRSIQPSAWGKSAFTAAIAQWRDKPEEWGQGMEGYGKRYGHRIVNRFVESAIGLGVSGALRQDARYFRKPVGPKKSRLWHALSQTFVTRTDSGGKTFAAWRVAGNYGGQFVSNAWRPERQRNPGETMIRGTISLGYDAASNVFKEFWPDIRRIVFKR
jgi:hypothetical protein